MPASSRSSNDLADASYSSSSYPVVKEESQTMMDVADESREASSSASPIHRGSASEGFTAVSFAAASSAVAATSVTASKIFTASSSTSPKPSSSSSSPRPSSSSAAVANFDYFHSEMSRSSSVSSVRPSSTIGRPLASASPATAAAVAAAASTSASVRSAPNLAALLFSKENFGDRSRYEEHVVNRIKQLRKQVWDVSRFIVPFLVHSDIEAVSLEIGFNLESKKGEKLICIKQLNSNTFILVSRV